MVTRYFLQCTQRLLIHSSLGFCAPPALFIAPRLALLLHPSLGFPGRTKVVQMLLEAGCNVNAANKTGVQAVHQAAGKGEVSILEALKQVWRRNALEQGLHSFRSRKDPNSPGTVRKLPTSSAVE